MLTAETNPSTHKLRPARIAVTQYHAMIEAGILSEDDPVELIDNQLVQTMPQGPRHAIVQEEIAERARGVCGSGCHVRGEKPLTMLESEPEPDVAVVRGERAEYLSRHPGGEDCLVVVEVAASSLDLDLLKADVYAAAGVPEYWLVDLSGPRLLVHIDPRPGGYATVRERTACETQLPGGTLKFSVDELPSE